MRGKRARTKGKARTKAKAQKRPATASRRASPRPTKRRMAHLLRLLRTTCRSQNPRCPLFAFRSGPGQDLPARLRVCVS